MLTQTERLLDYLNCHPEGIEPLVALNVLGIYRLAGRIHDLKKLGVPIVADTVEVHNRFGEKIKVARYRKVEQ